MRPPVKFRQLLLPLLTLAFFVAACAETPQLGPNPFNNLNGGNGTGGPTPTNNNTDRIITNPGPEGEWLNNAIRWVQPPNKEILYNKADVLFIIDTSSSLDDEIAAIKDGIESFLNQIPDSVDVRIAVLLAHINTVHSGKLFQRGTEPLVIDANSATAVTDFRAKLDRISSVGEGLSDGGEALLYAMTKLMRSENLSVARSQGFFRTDAALVTLFVTDENDICSWAKKDALAAQGINLIHDPYEVSAFNNYCKDSNGNVIISENTVYAGLRELQRDSTAIEGYRPLTIGGLIHSGENPVPARNENELAYGIKELITLQNGVAVDLADPAPDVNTAAPNPARIATGLAQIGLSVTQSLSNLKRVFDLPHYSTVDRTSIVVKVENEPVSFTINDTTRQLEIPSSAAGGPGDIIDITYRYWQASGS